MGGVKTARQAAKDADLENLAFEMRAYAEGLHGCSIGFSPWAPCTCPIGQMASRLWVILHPRANKDDGEALRGLIDLAADATIAAQRKKEAPH